MFGLVCDDKFSISSQKNSVSKDFFGKPFLDIYFCPFLRNQNTFHFSKVNHFPSYVGNKNRPKIREFKESPFIM